jgi:hypothetical protein
VSSTRTTRQACSGVVLRVVEQHRLVHLQLRLRSHEPAVSVDHLRHGFELLAFALGVFRDHRSADAQHDAFAAATVFRIARACHGEKKGSQISGSASS